MRKRNIKLNVYLNEEEKNMLQRKANKAVLSQSDFIRQLIYDYIEFDTSKKNITDIKISLLNINDDLIKLKNKLHNLGYKNGEMFLEELLYRLSNIITNELEIH